MDIKEYEEFCKNSKYGNFMQSADWAKVKKGWIPEYVAVRDENGKNQRLYTRACKENTDSQHGNALCTEGLCMRHSRQ